MTGSRINVGETDGRLCAAQNCRKPLVRHLNESHHHYGARVCCGRACVTRLQQERAGYVDVGCGNGRECHGCAAPMIRKIGETMSNFRKRSCCSDACAKACQIRNNANRQKSRSSAGGNGGRWPQLSARAFANEIVEGTPHFVSLPRPDHAHVSGCGSSAQMAAEHWGAKW